MPIIRTVDEGQATGLMGELYNDLGHVPERIKGLSLNPAATVAWEEMSGAIGRSLPFTLAAAFAPRMRRGNP